MDGYMISLEAARVNAKLTQEQAAKHVGIRKETLSSWERGITYPKANQLDKLLKLYKAPKDIVKI